MKLYPYLKMHGNTRDALNKYTKVFDGTIKRLNQFKDSPLANQENKDMIIHSEFHFKGNIICFADMISKENSDKIKSQSVQQLYQLCLDFGPKQLQIAQNIFNDLSENGQVLMKFEKTFWQAYYGKVKDQFGIIWSLNCVFQQQKSQSKSSQKNKNSNNKSEQKNNQSTKKSQKQ